MKTLREVAEGLTVAQIEDLRRAAETAGDLAQVRLCDLAKAGDLSAQTKCAVVIWDAMGREEG